jgi:hypothetical protein
MKKIALLSLMFVTLFAGTTFATEMKSANPSFEGVWIKIHIVFHKPKNDCKTGFGICTFFEAGIDQTEPFGPFCQAKARINENNQLVIEVTESALVSYENGGTLQYFKDKSSITLDEPYTLSPAASKTLGSPKTITIKSGTYPLVYSKGIYTITIQL